MYADAIIYGKSGTPYYFSSIPKENDSEYFPEIFSLYVKLFKYADTGNHEWIETNETFATYKLCLTNESKADMDFITNDLKEDGNFTRKIIYANN